MLERVDIILSLPNISICICTGLILIVINYWIKDVIREYIKKYEVLIIMLFIVFLIFIFSEGILFVSLFWITVTNSINSLKKYFYLMVVS